MTKRTVAILATAVLLTGCSSQAPPETTQAGGAAATAPKTPFTSAGGSAELVAALAAKIPTVKLTKAFTEDDDPNSMLGRPDGYVGKAAFADSRVKTADRVPGQVDTANGGGVEVFTTTAEAEARKSVIAAALKGAGGTLGTEYLYVSGSALLRVSGNLTPTVAREYEAVWPAVVGEVL